MVLVNTLKKLLKKRIISYLVATFLTNPQAHMHIPKKTSPGIEAELGYSLQNFIIAVLYDSHRLIMYIPCSPEASLFCSCLETFYFPPRFIKHELGDTWKLGNSADDRAGP